MATIKSHTDLSQSKKLAKILPLESADMSYSYNFDDSVYNLRAVSYSDWIIPKYAESNKIKQVIPCWSLAALLSVLPIPSLHQTEGKRWYCNAEPNRLYFSNHCDNPIDACVAMIEKLHELKML